MGQINKLEPISDPWIDELTKNHALIHQAINLHLGPVHLINPRRMALNVDLFRSIAENCGVPLSLLFAHKPTKSPAFIREAENLKLGIDVASLQEFVSALAAGFRGERIAVSGHKNEDLLLLAMKHQATISIDSISELQRLIKAKAHYPGASSAKVLLRLERLTSAGRELAPKDSKFGIVIEDLNEAFNLLKDHKEIRLVGYHHHSEEQDPDYRSAQATALATLLKDSYSLGFEPTIINIGGGFRHQQLRDPSAWQRSVESIEFNLAHNQPLNTWRNHTYGMVLTKEGAILNHSAALNRFASTSTEVVMKAILNAPAPGGGSLGRFLTENDFTLMAEPGSALLHNCGVSLVEVIESKKATNGRYITIVNTHALNLSQRGKEIGTDPILIPGPNNLGTGDSNQGPIESFIGGNLCRETDFISARSTPFTHLPRSGDILCFYNTAAYFTDFEESSPHQHPTGRKFVYDTKSGTPLLKCEDRYYPEGNS